MRNQNEPVMRLMCARDVFDRDERWRLAQTRMRKSEEDPNLDRRSLLRINRELREQMRDLQRRNEKLEKELAACKQAKDPSFGKPVSEQFRRRLTKEGSGSRTKQLLAEIDTLKHRLNVEAAKRSLSRDLAREANMEVSMVVSHKIRGIDRMIQHIRSHNQTYEAN